MLKCREEYWTIRQKRSKVVELYNYRNTAASVEAKGFKFVIYLDIDNIIFYILHLSSDTKQLIN